MFRCLKHFFTVFLIILLSGCKPASQLGDIDIQSVTLEQMEQLIQQHEWVLVDARESDRYNGWPSASAAQGGHIPGARNFDLEWISAEQASIDRLLETKGIRPSRGIVIYGGGDLDARLLAQWFVEEQGFSEGRIRVYNEAFSGWLAQGGKPVTVPGYKRLVPPEWLLQRLEKGDRLKILDVSFGTPLRQGGTLSDRAYPRGAAC